MIFSSLVSFYCGNINESTSIFFSSFVSGYMFIFLKLLSKKLRYLFLMLLMREAEIFFSFSKLNYFWFLISIDWPVSEFFPWFLLRSTIMLLWITFFLDLVQAYFFLLKILGLGWGESNLIIFPDLKFLLFWLCVILAWGDLFTINGLLFLWKKLA